MQDVRLGHRTHVRTASLTESSQEAVENGTVPHAVAITPDGEFTAGDVTPDSLFWLASMTKPITTLGALRLAIWTWTPRSPTTSRTSRNSRCSRAAATTAEDPGDGAGNCSPTRPGLGYYFWTPELLEWRREHGAGRAQDLRGAAGRRSRHPLRVRHQHGLARARDRSRVRPTARRLSARRRSSRRSEWPTRHFIRRPSSASARPDPRPQGRRVAGARTRDRRRPGVARRRPRPLLDAPRLRPIRAGAARRTRPVRTPGRLPRPPDQRAPPRRRPT